MHKSKLTMGFIAIIIIVISCGKLPVSQQQETIAHMSFTVKVNGIPSLSAEVGDEIVTQVRVLSVTNDSESRLLFYSAVLRTSDSSVVVPTGVRYFQKTGTEAQIYSSSIAFNASSAPSSSFRIGEIFDVKWKAMNPGTVELSVVFVWNTEIPKAVFSNNKIRITVR